MSNTCGFNNPVTTVGAKLFNNPDVRSRTPQVDTGTHNCAVCARRFTPEPGLPDTCSYWCYAYRRDHPKTTTTSGRCGPGTACGTRQMALDSRDQPQTG